MWPPSSGASTSRVNISDHGAHSSHATLGLHWLLHNVEYLHDRPPLVVLDAQPHVPVQHLVPPQAVQDDKGSQTARPVLVIDLTAVAAGDTAEQVPGFFEIHEGDALLVFGLTHPT